MVQRIRNIRDEREGGFTLIELLIVIVVLGILAGIVVFGVGTFRADSQTAACKADLKTVSVAADAWNAKFGKYEQVDAAGVPTGAGLTVADLVTAVYLKATPALADGTISIDAAGLVTQAGGPAGCVLA